MGKIFARFRNPYAAAQSQQPPPASSLMTPNSQIVSHRIIETNKQETTMKLREINNYAEYQNVLCTESASNSSLCLFGIDDFVREFFFLE